MKKMLRIAAALAALLAMTNFIGCKNDDDDDGDVAVTEVKFTSTVTEVTVGKTITLKAEVLPADATNKTVTWTSSDATVATVKDGVVTGVKAGETTITASAGGQTATVKVTVKAAATSGGETGTTTEFENTYWVLEEKVSEFSGMKVTLQNFKYVYINDSTSGLVYMPDIDTAVEELAKTGGGKRTVAYGEVTGNAFTYTVEGKNIILTATSEGKTETLTGTIVDENTLRFT
ncbi:MAG: Ig-like domain-containing protein, partial [Treponema berlinense]|nr:Ig-like domain-containing protein [Treponema berlinense]